MDGRTTRHAGYAVTPRGRKRVEEVFGWLKTVGGGRKLRYVGRARNRSWLEFAAAAYNLVRMAKLELAPAAAAIGAVRPATAQEGAEAPGRPFEQTR